MENTANGFCSWLEGVLDSEQPFDTTLTQKVRARLSQAFLHDIDKTFPAHLQHALHDAHTGEATPIYINGVKMGKDGETPDFGAYWDANSWDHDPQARC